MRAGIRSPAASSRWCPTASVGRKIDAHARYPRPDAAGPLSGGGARYLARLGVILAALSLLIERNHEVALVERDKARIDALVDELDCGFIHGDGSHPAVLREAMPEETDALFCLSGRDQDNIIASLVGRSLGFRKVITRIEDEELEYITLALGLEQCVVPDRTMGRYLRPWRAPYFYPTPQDLTRKPAYVAEGGLGIQRKSVGRDLHPT